MRMRTPNPMVIQIHEYEASDEYGYAYANGMMWKMAMQLKREMTLK